MYRKDAFIATYTGRTFHLLDPQPDDISIIDISHALSNICRYTGHAPFFYSVAQHSLLMAQYLDNHAAGIEIVRAALLHDAAEAYVGDMSTPLKNLFPEYQAVEWCIQRAIMCKFGVTLAPEISCAVREIDQAMLRAEALRLGMLTPEWSCYAARKIDVDIPPQSARETRAEFLNFYKQVFY